MILKHLSIINFKNLSSVELDFSPKVNCFVGANGMGKTNVLDAIYYLSFLKSSIYTQDSLNIKHNENFFIIGFIVVSTLILIFLGKPVKLLVLAGSLNGLILPITLAITLIASKKEGIVGKYKHSNILFYLGWVVVLVTAYIGVKSLAKLAELFA